MGYAVAGRQPQGDPETGGRFGKPPQSTIGLPQVDVKIGLIGLNRDRFCDIPDGRRVVSLLAGTYAEKMDCIDVAGIYLQNLSVNTLRSLQPTGLVVFEGSSECLGDGCHGEEDRDWVHCRHTLRSSGMRLFANRLPSHSGERAMPVAQTPHEFAILQGRASPALQNPIG